MALSTRSRFYYGWKVTASNRYVDFTYQSINYIAILDIGSYSSQELSDHVVLKMSDASGGTFSGSFNRTTRGFTFSEALGFTFLFNTGIHAGLSSALLLGFSATNYSGTSITSNLSSGYIYTPQFYLQSYKPSDKNRRAIDGVVNKAASGEIEVIKFGYERFVEFENVFITNVRQQAVSIITNSQTAIEDYISFIEYATDKNKVEFIKDSTKVETFQTLLLESTVNDQSGLSYELIELYDKGLPEYFRSGNLKFRLME